MTEIDDDFFAAPDGPERDRWERPLLFPRGSDIKKPYTRASSLADKIEDFTHIWKWKMRYLARSLGRNPALAALAGCEVYTTGFDRGDEADNRASGKRLDEVIERALDRAGINDKADYGTVVHAITEPGNDGLADWYQNAEIDRLSMAAKFEELGIKILGTELFTANDHLMSAGTFDHLLWVPGYGICIGDKKTSSAVHGNSFRVQLAVYANADLYDWENDTRTSLEDYVASLGWDPALINRDAGFIVWIKDGKTTLHRLDLAAGLEAAEHAAWVRDNHLKGKHSWAADKTIADRRIVARADLGRRISSAGTEDDILELWEVASYRAIWNDGHTAAAKLRKAELTS